MVDSHAHDDRPIASYERDALSALDGETEGVRLRVPQLSQTKRHPLSWSTSDQYGAALEPTSSGRSIRNRHSLFSRSSLSGPASSHSGAKPVKDGRNQNPRHSALSTGAQTPDSLSSDLPKLRSSAFRALRQSFQFGKKRPESTVAPSSRSLWPRKRLSKVDRSYSAEPSTGRDRFQTEEEYYRCLKKNSISPPFDFHHITHTARDNLPSLEDVNEDELSARFRAIQSHQSPRRHLHGIKVDELPSRSSSPTQGQRYQLGNDRPAHSPAHSPVQSPVQSPAHSPTSSTLPTLASNVVSVEKRLPDLPQDSPVPNNVTSRKAVPGVSTELKTPISKYRSQPETNRLPTRTSSLPAFKAVPSESIVRGIDSVVDLGASGLSPLKEEVSEHEPTGRPTSSTTLDLIHDDAFRDLGASVSPPTKRRSSLENIIRSPSPFEAPKIPLPPTPLTPPSQKRSNLSAQAPTAAVVAGAILPDVSSSWRSSSSRTLHLFPNVPKTPPKLHHAKQPSMSFSRWRDDVDFAYEQEMESTCDFNWDEASTSKANPKPSLDTTTVERRASTYCPQSQLMLNANEAMHLRTVSSVASLANRAGGMHRSRPSVGHKGFAEARRTSISQLRNRMSRPPMLELELSEGPVFGRFSTIFPRSIMSLSEDDGGIQHLGSLHPKLSTGASELAPAPASIDTASLSDQEPSTGSSKHRKSSSYSSFESHHRRRLSRKASNRNNSQSSSSLLSTSSASMPDLIHPLRKPLSSSSTSSNKRKHSIRKSSISRPSSKVYREKTAEGRNENDDDEEDSTIVPRALRSEPMRSAFVMHRRLSQGNGGVPQGATKRYSRNGLIPLKLAPSPVTEHLPIPESPTFGSGSEAGWI